jgi:integrase/recombinase XerD
MKRQTHPQLSAAGELALTQYEQALREVAKLPDMSPHDLGHRFGYRMAESVPLPRLAQIMGHDSLDTTTLYMQGTKQDVQEDAQTFAWTEEQLLRGAPICE